jgi:predicted nucleotidyltransferase
MIQLKSNHLTTVINLSKYPYQFYAYGPRVKGTARDYSDLDLCIKIMIIGTIQDDFENSNLPFKIDLIN